MSEPEVSWKAVDAGAAILATGGEEIGKLKEVVGDEEADIFDGLVTSDNRYIASERVKQIWLDRIEVDVSAEEAASLPKYEEPAEVVHWQPSRGFLQRLRDLFGPRPRV